MAFQNPKTIRKKLIRSELKEFIYEDDSTNTCGHSNCNTSKILKSGDQFESTITKKKYHINFPFDCNSCYVVYLLTCTVCLKQYVRVRLRFNQYKYKLKVDSTFFFLCSRNGIHEDIKVQIIDHCDPNDQEAREDFWIFHLDTLHPKGLNQKGSLKY